MAKDKSEDKTETSRNAEQSADDRGRNAAVPEEIPKTGWRDVSLRVKEQLEKDNINIVAAGVAFYAFLALFPAIIATILIYALVVDPQTVEQQLGTLTSFMPEEVRELLSQQLSKTASQAANALGWGVLASILFGLWSANKGMKALFRGINIAYNEDDDRGFIKQNAITLLATLIGIIVVILMAMLIVALPLALEKLPLAAWMQAVWRLARWPVLTFLLLLCLAALYRYAPVRDQPRWRWVSWGAFIATALWLVVSWGFSFYVSKFGSYNKTYGSLAAVVILMMWFLLSSYAVLLGAEIDSEIEAQTKNDTTVGPEEPMGERGAYHADNLGKTP